MNLLFSAAKTDGGVPQQRLYLVAMRELRDIPDPYDYMQPELVTILEPRVSRILRFT